MSRPKVWLCFLDLLISVCAGLLLIVALFCMQPCDAANSLVNEEFITTYQDIINWETEYSDQIRDATFSQLQVIPAPIFESWVEDNGLIIIVPDQRGYLDDSAAVYSSSANELSTFTIAYNDIRTVNNHIDYSHIYVLGNEEYIKYAILHEFGHYVYYKHFGMKSEYVLPNYERDCESFVSNIENNNQYYASPDEYFAEMFAYTVMYGVDNQYQDTFIMQKIIDNF